MLEKYPTIKEIGGIGIMLVFLVAFLIVCSIFISPTKKQPVDADCYDSGRGLICK